MRGFIVDGTLISLDFSSVLTCNSNKPCSLAQALTMWSGFFPFRRLCQQRDVFPSIDIISWQSLTSISSLNDWVHSIKHASKVDESSTEKTRPKVSWEGIPCGNSRNPRSQSSLLFPKLLNSTQLSAPQILPNIVCYMFLLKRVFTWIHKHSFFTYLGMKPCCTPFINN